MRSFRINARNLSGSALIVLPVMGSALLMPSSPAVMSAEAQDAPVADSPVDGERAGDAGYAPAPEPVRETGEIFSVSQVTVEGNRRIDTQAIKTQLKSAPGTITRSTVSDDIKNLYKTGFFDQVRAGMSDTGGLRFSVVEKPVVRKIFIQGNSEVKEEELRDVLKLPGRRFLDKAKIQSLIKAAVVHYQNQGFYDAGFQYSVAPVGDNEVDLTFTVTEGSRYKIREITFPGIREVDESELKSTMQTKRYKWWSSWILGTGRLNPDMLDNDRTLLRQFLLDHGYVDASVGEAVIQKEEDGLYVKLPLAEGPQYKIGSVKVQGDLIEKSQEKTLEDIELEKGDVFSATSIREQSFKVSDKFSDLGYAFANVVPYTQVNRERKEVDLQLNVDKGQLVTINRINVKGNEKTYDNVVRREMAVQEQERYSGKKVKRSQTVLQRLGYFEEVNVATVPTDDPKKVDLDVNVREGSTGSFSVGAGFSSGFGALFNARVAENNLFGTGRRLNLNVDVGARQDSVILSFDDPRVNDTRLSLGTDISLYDRVYPDFSRRIAGGGLTAGYPMDAVFGEEFEDIKAALKYEYLDINIYKIDSTSAAQFVKDSEGRTTASGFTPSLSRSTVNNPLNPTRGSKQNLSLEVTGAGGNQEFFLLEARNQWYYPFVELPWGELVFSNRTHFGYGDTFDSKEKFPLYRRFFPGGINSNRGYRVRSLGPKDADGNEFGGSKELVNNAEVIFPLVNAAGLNGVVFYDAGEAFDDDQSVKFADLRLAYGAGIRWNSPLGPIRLEFGFPIDRKENESSMVTQFSFGAPF